MNGFDKDWDKVRIHRPKNHCVGSSIGGGFRDATKVPTDANDCPFDFLLAVVCRSLESVCRVEDMKIIGKIGKIII